MSKSSEARPGSFLFRSLPKGIEIGMASVRYAGWIGQDSKNRMAHKVQFNLIINNRAGGNAPLIAQKITDGLHSEKQQKVF